MGLVDASACDFYILSCMFATFVHVCKCECAQLVYVYEYICKRLQQTQTVIFCWKDESVHWSRLIDQVLSLR